MFSRIKGVAFCATAAALMAACGVTPNTGSPDDRRILESQGRDALSQFEGVDYSLHQRMDTAYAYAIFPNVITAAVGLGGGHGNGEVYQNGRLIGYADMSQGSIGVQLGAQKFAELILFQNAGSLAEFQRSTLEFDARASAVAAASGAAATADYSKGVLVFTLPQSGLMVQAAIGGQKFRYSPVDYSPMYTPTGYSPAGNPPAIHSSSNYSPMDSGSISTPPVRDPALDQAPSHPVPNNPAVNEPLVTPNPQ